MARYEVAITDGDSVISHASNHPSKSLHVILFLVITTFVPLGLVSAVDLCALYSAGCSGSTQLDLEYVDINYPVLDAAFFEDLETPELLEVVIMQFNSIESVDKNALVSLTNVRILRLAENFLTTLPVGVFNSQTRMVELRIQANRFSQPLPYGFFFDCCNELTFLDLGINSFQYFDDDGSSFQTLPKLMDFRLTINSITYLHPDTFLAQTQMVLLYIGDNQFTDAPHEWFQTLTSLQSLWMANVPITRFTLRHVQNLVSLVEFDLGGCRLTSLPEDVFSGHFGNHLTSIKLQGNRLTWLPEYLIEELTLLNTLQLENNPLIQCFPAENYMGHFNSLGVVTYDYPTCGPRSSISSLSRFSIETFQYGSYPYWHSAWKTSTGSISIVFEAICDDDVIVGLYAGTLPNRPDVITADDLAAYQVVGSSFRMYEIGFASEGNSAAALRFSPQNPFSADDFEDAVRTETPPFCSGTGDTGSFASAWLTYTFDDELGRSELKMGFGDQIDQDEVLSKIWLRNAHPISYFSFTNYATTYRLRNIDFQEYVPVQAPSATLKNELTELLVRWFVLDTGDSLSSTSASISTCNLTEMFEPKTLVDLGHGSSCFRSSSRSAIPSEEETLSVKTTVVLGMGSTLIPGSIVRMRTQALPSNVLAVPSSTLASESMEVIVSESNEGPPEPIADLRAVWEKKSSADCSLPSHLMMDASASTGLAGRNATFYFVIRSPNILSGFPLLTEHSTSPLLRVSVQDILDRQSRLFEAAINLTDIPDELLSSGSFTVDVFVRVTNAFDLFDVAFVRNLVYNDDDLSLQLLPRLSVPARVRSLRSSPLLLVDTVTLPLCSFLNYSFVWSISQVNDTTENNSSLASDQIRKDRASLYVPSNTFEAPSSYSLKLSVFHSSIVGALAEATSIAEISRADISAFINFTDQTVSPASPLYLDASSSFDPEQHRLLFRWTCKTLPDDFVIGSSSNAIPQPCYSSSSNLSEAFTMSSGSSLLYLPRDTLEPGFVYVVEVETSTEEAVPRSARARVLLNTTIFGTSHDDSTDGGSHLQLPSWKPFLELNTRKCTPEPAVQAQDTSNSIISSRLCSVGPRESLVIDALVWFELAPDDFELKLTYEWEHPLSELQQTHRNDDFNATEPQSFALLIESDLLQNLPPNYVVPVSLTLKVIGEEDATLWITTSSLSIRVNSQPVQGRCHILDLSTTLDESTTSLDDEHNHVFNITAFESGLSILCQGWVFTPKPDYALEYALAVLPHNATDADDDLHNSTTYERVLRPFQHLSLIDLEFPPGRWQVIVYVKASPSHGVGDSQRARYRVPGLVHSREPPSVYEDPERLQQLWDQFRAAEQSSDISRLVLMGTALLLLPSNGTDDVELADALEKNTEGVLASLNNIVEGGSDGILVDRSLAAELLLDVLNLARPALEQRQLRLWRHSESHSSPVAPVDAKGGNDLSSSGSRMIDLAIAGVRRSPSTLRPSSAMLQHDLLPLISSVANPRSCSDVERATLRSEEALSATADDLLQLRNHITFRYADTSSAPSAVSSTYSTEPAFPTLALHRSQRGINSSTIGTPTTRVSNSDQDMLLQAPFFSGDADDEDSSTIFLSKIAYSRQIGQLCFDSSSSGDAVNDTNGILGSNVISICRLVNETGQCERSEVLPSNIYFSIFKNPPNEQRRGTVLLCSAFDRVQKQWTSEYCSTEMLEDGHQSDAPGSNIEHHPQAVCSCSRLGEFALVWTVEDPSDDNNINSTNLNTTTTAESLVYIDNEFGTIISLVYPHAGLGFLIVAVVLVSIDTTQSARAHIVGDMSRTLFIRISVILTLAAIARVFSVVSISNLASVLLHAKDDATLSMEDHDVIVHLLDRVNAVEMFLVVAHFWIISTMFNTCISMRFNVDKDTIVVNQSMKPSSRAHRLQATATLIVGNIVIVSLAVIALLRMSSDYTPHRSPLVQMTLAVLCTVFVTVFSVFGRRLQAQVTEPAFSVDLDPSKQNWWDRLRDINSLKRFGLSLQVIFVLRIIIWVSPIVLQYTSISHLPLTSSAIMICDVLTAGVATVFQRKTLKVAKSARRASAGAILGEKRLSGASIVPISIPTRGPSKPARN